MEPVFRSPTIKKLGTAARDALVAIAAFPRGVEECKLDSVFPGIVGVGEAVDVLRRFSLVYRRDGFVKMLSPFRFYFVMSALEPAQFSEVIRWGPDCHPEKPCTSFSFHLSCGHMAMLLEGLPVYTSGKPTSGPSRVTQRPETSPREKWVRRFRIMKRSEYNGSDSPWLIPLIIL